MCTLMPYAEYIHAEHSKPPMHVWRFEARAISAHLMGGMCFIYEFTSFYLLLSFRRGH